MIGILEKLEKQHKGEDTAIVLVGSKPNSEEKGEVYDIDRINSIPTKNKTFIYIHPKLQ